MPQSAIVKKLYKIIVNFISLDNGIMVILKRKKKFLLVRGTY